MNDESWALAIDFGTTATAAAVRDGSGEVRGLPLTEGGPAGLAMPSAVFADHDGTLVAGTMAENLAAMDPTAFDPTPKRRIAAKTMHLGNQDYTPAQVIGAVLAPVLAEAYRQHNGVPPASVTLTHPESWKTSRRQLLTQAYLSGIGIASAPDAPPPVFVSEPEAAAHWYARHGLPPAGQHFAIYDLGGGTFDTTVLRSTGTGFEVIASGGKDPLGGCDFDDALFDHLGRHYVEPRDSQLWQQLRSGGPGEISTQRHALRTRVRMAKEQLTVQPRVTLRGVPGHLEPVTISATDDYEPLIREYVDETVTELTDTLAEAGLTPQDLTAIYRIGGAARTPLVRAALDRLQCPVKDIDEPKLVVAQGAALLTSTRTPTRAQPQQSQSRAAFADPNLGGGTSGGQQGSGAGAANDMTQHTPREDPPRQQGTATPPHLMPRDAADAGAHPGTTPSRSVPVALLVSCWILSAFPVLGLVFGLLARAQIKKTGRRGAGFTVPVIIIGVMSTIWLLGRLAAG